MTPFALGKLAKADIRSVWPEEAQHFTPWLADNLEILMEILGLELELEAVEKFVGPFRADILCKDTVTGSWVLIENQYGKTDHSHLGQLLTYAAGLGAVTIVWIAERFTSEHRAALDWLNTSTAESVNFFGLELELWKIGNSEAAPKFNVVSQPNDWVRTVTTLTAEPHSATAQLQLEFWQSFYQYAKKSKIIKPQKPQPQHWMDFSVGKSGFFLGARVHTKNNVLGVGLYISDDVSKTKFKYLEALRTQIDIQIGVTPEWIENQGKKRSQVELRLSNADLHQRNEWPSYQDWILKQLEAFYKAFSEPIKSIPETSNETLVEAD